MKASAWAKLVRTPPLLDVAEPVSHNIRVLSGHDFSVNLIFQGRLRCAFSGQDSGHQRLHQTAGVTAAMAAHQPPDGVPSSVEAVNRLLVFVQNFGASIHQDATHRESEPGNDSQTIEWRAQRSRLAGARDTQRAEVIRTDGAIIIVERPSKSLIIDTEDFRQSLDG